MWTQQHTEKSLAGTRTELARHVAGGITIVRTNCTYILRITTISSDCDISKQGRPVPTNTASNKLDCPYCPHFPLSKHRFSLSFLHSLSLMTSVINNTNATCVNKSLTFVTICTCLMPVTATAANCWHHSAVCTSDCS